MSSDAIYTVHVSKEVHGLATAVLATTSFLLVLHVLMAGQVSTGLAGSLFNHPFAETLAKVLIAVGFYFLIVRRVVQIQTSA